jgi:Glutamine amidotransferases class-II
MCRMLGYVTRTPATLADLLGEQDLQDLAELSREHGGGWGFARAVGDVMEVTKTADAARTSSLFSRVTHQVLADLAIVHLRRATMGLQVADCNAHPSATAGPLSPTTAGSVLRLRSRRCCLRRPACSCRGTPTATVSSSPSCLVWATRWRSRTASSPRSPSPSPRSLRR